MAFEMEEENWTVTNADTGEVLAVEDATSKFSVLSLTGFSSEDETMRGSMMSTEAEARLESVGEYYDAKQSLTTRESTGGENYIPLSVPEGGRLQFSRISAVGTARDDENKAYSVYYIDVKCNVASPNNWFVYRRYSQFRKLSDVLRSEGYYVPVLPPKKILGTFTPEFVRQRRADLEAWLVNLGEQHTMYQGAKDPQTHPFYRTFLTEGANKPPLPLVRVYPEPARQPSADAKDGDFSRMSEEETYKAEAAAKRDKVNIDDFELVRVIGKGSFGKVTLVRKKADNKLYAMKVLAKQNIIKRKQVEHTKTERNVLGKLNHPFIVKLHYAFQTEVKL
jgi:hypothetical protein